MLQSLKPEKKMKTKSKLALAAIAVALLALLLLWPSRDRYGEDLQADDGLDALVGQMVMVGFRGQELDPDSNLARDLAAGRLGGVILFDYDIVLKMRGRNIKDPAQVKRLTTALQKHSPTPLFIAVDQEGGKVARFKKSNGFQDFPSARQMGRSGASLAQKSGHDTGLMLASLGVNLNFAPSVDVDVNPKSPAIGALDRSFSASPTTTAELAGIWLKAMQDTGVLGCIKHFPGHGSARDDSHLNLPDVSRTWTQAELEPYRALINSGQAHMVMLGHLFNANIDPDYPSSLSRKTVTGLLREQLGFNGVIVTDDMQMGAITDQYGLEQAVRLAVLAGVDLLVFGNNLVYDPADTGVQARRVIAKMVRDGVIDRARIEASVARLNALKQTWVK